MEVDSSTMASSSPSPAAPALPPAPSAPPSSTSGAFIRKMALCFSFAIAPRNLNSPVPGAVGAVPSGLLDVACGGGGKRM